MNFTTFMHFRDSVNFFILLRPVLFDMRFDHRVAGKEKSSSFPRSLLPRAMSLVLEEKRTGIWQSLVTVSYKNCAFVGVVPEMPGSKYQNIKNYTPGTKKLKRIRKKVI